MRSRVLALTVAVYLSLAVLACSKQPAENTSSTDTTTGTTATNTAPENATRAERAAPKPLVVPAGTVITVRLSQSVGSKISQPGQSFSATVAQPVAVEGKTVIPAGATASGTVVDAKPLGRFKGGAVLELKLDSVTVNGAPQQISTAAVM